jgi:hypothetical protein
MSLRPNVYDEGLVLTAAMRVALGQIPHRDFYTNYGPAQFYILAGLFNAFGTSILVERLFDLSIKALSVTVVYAIASFYCRTTIAVGISIVALLWTFGVMNETCGAAITPVSLLNLIGTALILSIFRSPVPTKRMLAAGVVAGTATLFRYDTGVLLIVISTCAIAFATLARLRGPQARARAFGSALGLYIFGFLVVVLPPVIYYLSVAPVRPLIHDFFLYPVRYYHSGRNLPFPRISLSELDQSAIYSIIAIILISIVLACFRVGDNTQSSLNTRGKESYREFLIAFGLLAFGMYIKGFVRVHLTHLFLSIIPSGLLLAILVENRSTFPRTVRLSVMFLASLFVSSSLWSARIELRSLRSQRSSLAHLAKSVLLRRDAPEILAEWCKTTNPLTSGICFLTDYGRIQTIEFIGSHTVPSQRLFVGLTSHDRIFANDNIIYFATQRLPATKWSHFDPDLQNRYDVQAEMIRELDSNDPPYIVRDSEFDSVREPNDSSKSSGITLLDGYLRKEYHPINTFGTMSVWQRTR